MVKFVISVDGPSGSGKEKISKYIAKKYNLFHLDSGILYRRLSYLIIKNKINIRSKKQINIYLRSIKIFDYRNSKVLRSEEISNKASEIAKLLIIRNFINNVQKKTVKNVLKSRKGCVIDGRDIGSKVFKNAKIKLFIDVNARIRAKRRHKQLIERGEKSIYTRILKDIILRDKRDTNRAISPLIVPKGAIIIDNSLSFKNTVIQINNALRKLK